MTWVLEISLLFLQVLEVFFLSVQKWDKKADIFVIDINARKAQYINGNGYNHK